MSEEFKNKIRRAMRMGEVFYEVYNDLRKNHIVYDFEQFKEGLEQDQDLAGKDVIVFEKMISWTDQSIWFSQIQTMEIVRLKFLTKGIEVTDDTEDETGHTLFMKESE